MKKASAKQQIMYTCPFCKKEVPFSKKTEVSYRNNWIKGCFECFKLSINEATSAQFQQKDY